MELPEERSHRELDTQTNELMRSPMRTPLSPAVLRNPTLEPQPLQAQELRGHHRWPFVNAGSIGDSLEHVRSRDLARFPEPIMTGSSPYPTSDICNSLAPVLSSRRKGTLHLPKSEQRLAAVAVSTGSRSDELLSSHRRHSEPAPGGYLLFRSPSDAAPVTPASERRQALMTSHHLGESSLPQVNLHRAFSESTSVHSTYARLFDFEEYKNTSGQIERVASPYSDCSTGRG